MSDIKQIAVDPERSSLFGMMGTASANEDKKHKVKDDGGSHIMREAMSKIIKESQVHKLYLMDMEEQETIDEYLRIKNGVAYNITEETPFEKVIEYTGEGEHTKEVRYKRIVEYTTIDPAILLESLIRETLLVTIPAVMGFNILNKYFPATKEDLKNKYKERISWEDPTKSDPTKSSTKKTKRHTKKK